MAQSQTVHYRIKKQKQKQNKTNKIKTKQKNKIKTNKHPPPKKNPPNPMTSTKRWLNTILAKYQERFEYQEHKIEDTARVQSEVVNQRNAHNTMVKRKRTNNDLQNNSQKTKD